MRNFQCLMVFIIMLPLMLILTACGSGGHISDDSGSDGGPAWVTIHSPSEGFLTSSATITVSGNAAWQNGSYPDGSIYWSTGSHSGTASKSVIWGIAAWEATVPLSVGSNTITVSFESASDSVTGSRYMLYDAQGTITYEDTGFRVPDVLVTLTSESIPVGSRLTDYRGDYSFASLPGGNYAVSPQSDSCLSFSPPSISFEVLSSNVSGLDFTAIRSATCFSVSGRIKNDISNGQADIEVTLTDIDGKEIVHYTDWAGYYYFYNLPPGTYTITPYQSSAAFEPSSIDLTITDSDLTQDFLIQY